MMFKKIYITFFLFFVLHNLVAQTDSLQHRFDEHQKKHVQEKLFVHTDKNVYLAGEILWFKIYDVDAFFHLPVHFSGIAYVEVLDKNNKQALQAKISLEQGSGDGSLHLPVTLNSGNYKLRAYTNWMKNAGPDFFFEKAITIINAQKIAETSAYQPVKYDIQFFPEGGNLVNTVTSKVAFKVVDQYGKGANCEGRLIDGNDTLLSFKTFRFGMGNFNFTPLTNHVYRALIKFPDGGSIIKELPRAYDKGYVMYMSANGNAQVQITVKQPAAVSPGSQSVYLFVQTRGVMKWSGTKQMQDGAVEFLVDADKLGDGISQFTVFNNDMQPVCERLYFKYPAQKLQIDVHADQQEYNTRRKINIDVSAADNAGKALPADMSLAVYRIDSLQTLDETDISNYLWLTSDLAGTIESPSFYFKNVGSETAEAMDNLMLTHGWRRFKWEDILQDRQQPAEFLPEYNGHIIIGRITDNNGLPGKHITGYLSVPGTRSQFKVTQSDDSGHVKFVMKDFYGSQEIIVQTNPQKDSIYHIDIANPFINKYSATALPQFSMPAKNPGTLLDESINMQVQNIYAGNKLQQFAMPAIDTSSFYVAPDERYLLDDYTRFTTYEEILREYVKAINVSRRDGKFYLRVYDQYTRFLFEKEPLILVDAVPFFDIDKFMHFDPLKIRKLEIVSKKYFLGYTSFDGILNFTTYNGDLNGYEPDPHALAIDYDALQLKREFYSPQYETEQQINSHLPDFRNLLYWSPEIKTNEQGKHSLSFFSSDLPGKYAVVVQGLSANGSTGSQVIMFDVKN